MNFGTTLSKKNKRSTLLSKSDLTKNENSLYGLPILLGLIAYSILHVNYNIYFGDDAWTISNVWNITNLGVAKDLVFIEPDAHGFQQYFGLTYAFIMGNLLNLLGWTKSNVFIVNSAFIWLTALVWWKTLQKLPFSKSVSQLTAAFLPLFPPFFFAAHTGRADALTVFIIASQFYLFVNKRYFFAALLTGFAIETHIMGVVGLFFILAYALYKREDLIKNKEHLRRLVLNFGLGGLTALAYYYYLHSDHFSVTGLTQLVTSKRDMTAPVNNYILSYFLEFDWMDHVWELILMISTMAIYLKKGIYRKNRFLFILMIVMVISTLITRRENRTYLVYVFPAFILMYFYTFEQLNRLKEFTIALMLTMGIYFAIKYFHNNDYDFERIVLEVEENCQNKSLPVMGLNDFWFAAKDRKFIPIHPSRDLSRLQLKEFYFIQSDYIGYRSFIYEYVRDHIFEHYNSSLIEEVSVMDDQSGIKVWRLTQKNIPVPRMVKQVYPGWKHEARKYLENAFSDTEE